MGTSTSSRYKLIKKIKSDKFSVDDIQHCNLLLQIGARDFQIAIVDSRNNNCLLLEDFILANITSNAQLIEVLSDIVESHHLVGAGFWKSVKASFKNSKFSLVPASLFVKEAMTDYLKINADINSDSEEVLYYKNIRSSSITVFAVNKELLAWVRGLYSNIKLGLIHQSSTLIEGVLNARENYPKNSLFLYIDRFKLHIIATKGNDIQYYNQFSIKQFSDYIKYIMLVINGLHLSQKATNVVLWGYIGKQSPHYTEFYKYIKNLSFGDRPDFLKFSYVFDEVQDHHFFDMYNVYLCE